ncbi:hypothetical protein Tco_0614482 [Tanacetum coccineum]
MDVIPTKKKFFKVVMHYLLGNTLLLDCEDQWLDDCVYRQEVLTFLTLGHNRTHRGIHSANTTARNVLLIPGFYGRNLITMPMHDESIYDAWTRFKNLIQRVPHHGLDLWSLTQLFYDHVDDYTRMDLDFAADGNLRELSGEEAWEAIENFAQGQKEWDSPLNIIFEQEVANLKAQAKRLFGNENVWVEMHRDIAWDKVENPNLQSTPQVLPSFEENTPTVTYPDEVEETIGLPIEVEPLDETPLEDLGLNTSNHDIPLSFRKIPSFDEPEPQPQPFPSFPSLEVDLGEERDPKPPIKPPSPNSFRMKEVDHLTIHTPPSPHVASFQPKDTYCYYHPCIDDPKKHYGFKLGLLGQSGSLGVDFSNLEMVETDWELESKEVYFLGRGLNSPVRPKEVEKVIFDEKKLGSS